MVERDYHHRQARRPVDRKLVVVVIAEDSATVPIDVGHGQGQSGHDRDFRHWLSTEDFGNDHPDPWEG